MRTGRMFHRDAQTFLVHLFGQRPRGRAATSSRSTAPIPTARFEPVQAGAGGVRRADASGGRTIVSRKAWSAVKKLRPERDEIIVCTGTQPEARLRHADVGSLRDATSCLAAGNVALTGVAGHAAQGPGEEEGAGSLRHRQRHAARVADGVRAPAAAGFLPSPASRSVPTVPRSAAPPTAHAVPEARQQGKPYAGRDPEQCRRADRAGDRRRRRVWKEARTLHVLRPPPAGGRAAPSASLAARQGAHSTAGAMTRAAPPAVACAAASPRSGACRAAAAASRWRRNASVPSKRAPPGRDAMSRGARRARVWIVESPPGARPAVRAAHIVPTPARPSVTWRRSGRRRFP